MDYTYTLQEYYIKYLVDVRHLSKSSVAHYLDAISWISKYLKRKSLLNDLLYLIQEEKGAMNRWNMRLNNWTHQ